MVEQKSIFQEQLEEMEKFVTDASKEEIFESANYLKNRIQLNIEKIKGGDDKKLLQVYVDLLNKIEMIYDECDPTPVFITSYTLGGLVHMFLGLMGCFKICKMLGFKLKIYMKTPFILDDYLLSNTYDWSISDDKYNSALKENNFVDFDYRCHDLEKLADLFFEKSKKSKYSMLKAQPHRFISPIEFQLFFNDLFKPSEELQKNINTHLDKLGGKGNYISVTLRFQQLLGDFKEGNFHILDPSERELLISQCIDHIMDLHNKYKEMKILVTSDSVSFLREAEKLSFTYVILEEIYHPFEAMNVNTNSWMKSFLDFFLIKNAKKVYQILDNLMYDSAFPRYAAILGKLPYNVLDYNDIRFEKAIEELHQSLYKKREINLLEKEQLTKNALASLTVRMQSHCLKHTGLHIYEKMQDAESKTIFKELFYYYFATGKNTQCHDMSHFQNILKITLKNRLEEKGNDLTEFETFDESFFMGNKYYDLPALQINEDEILIDVVTPQRDSNAPKICPCKYKPTQDQAGKIDLFIDKNEKVTFIKIDTESNEFAILIGSQKTIQRCKPKLAICISSRPKEDMINIPAYLLKLVPEYKFYIRHYCMSSGDTVLYAVM